ISVHGMELQHLRKKCPTAKDTTFPQSIKVSLNFSSRGQAHTLGNDIRMRSLSPWHYSLDKDHNRLPHIIAQAECQERCVDSEGEVDLNLNSIPIQQEILVLRRELSGCNQIFKLEKKIVTVGCTCVRARAD
ncbi:hypothetical protein FKM82_011341, partial [Ascaphus truei]